MKRPHTHEPCHDPVDILGVVGSERHARPLHRRPTVVRVTGRSKLMIYSVLTVRTPEGLCPSRRHRGWPQSAIIKGIDCRASDFYAKDPPED